MSWLLGAHWPSFGPSRRSARSGPLRVTRGHTATELGRSSPPASERPLAAQTKPRRGWLWRGVSSSTCVRDLGRRLLPVGREPLVDQSDDGVDILVLHALLLGDELHQLVSVFVVGRAVLVRARRRGRTRQAL